MWPRTSPWSAFTRATPASLKDQFLMMYKSSELLNDFNFASSAALPRLSGAHSGEIKRVNFETGLGDNKRSEA